VFTKRMLRKQSLWVWKACSLMSAVACSNGGSSQRLEADVGAAELADAGVVAKPSAWTGSQVCRGTALGMDVPTTALATVIEDIVVTTRAVTMSPVTVGIGDDYSCSGLELQGVVTRRVAGIPHFAFQDEEYCVSPNGRALRVKSADEGLLIDASASFQLELELDPPPVQLEQVVRITCTFELQQGEPR
jgi:hypothetical protein